MKNLVVNALVAGALTTSVGCIISDSDDPYGDFEVTWSPISQSNPCDLIASVDINARPAGSSAEPFTATYQSCESGLRSLELDLGEWEVWAGFYDSNDVLVAQSNAVTGTLVDDLVTEPLNLGDVPLDTAAFSLGWTINGAAADATSCNGIGAMKVHFQGVDGNSTEQTMDFDCIAGAGETPQWPLGQYQVTIDALDEFDASVVTPAEFLDVVTNDNPILEWGNQLYDIGTIDLAP